MDRRNAAAAAIAAIAAGGCNGGEPSDEAEVTVPPVLSTVAGDVDDVGLELTDSSCDDDVLDRFDELELKVSQAPTGLSVFVHEDLGWVPCDGWVQAFDCRWGEAYGPDDGAWRWRLWGAAEDGAFDAQLSLAITCDGAGRDCEDCEALAAVTGTLSR